MTTTKRDAICEAALTLIAKKGPDATTTREIAALAETAEGTIYRHFKGKDDLMQHLFVQSAEQFHAILSCRISGLEDHGERIRALVKGVFEFAVVHPDAFNFLLSTHHLAVLNTKKNPGPPLPARLFVETLEAGISSGCFRSVSPMLATGWVVSMAQRSVVLLQSGLLIPQSREQTIDETAEAAIRLLTP